MTRPSTSPASASTAVAGSTPPSRFAPGALVRARGREWVVLPESEGDLLVLRPLGGGDDDRAGIYLPIETVEAASFGLPDPARVGDHRSSRLLRDAVRLGLRSSAGPFRSFARLGFEPRPYQLVPLLMALKLDPVRMLVADDVGVGKTIEAGLIARELIDRGEARRLAVLCPPHLAEQWQRELAEKFHLFAELVLPSTASRLERGIGAFESLFDAYPHVIVSTDFIKSDRYRADFLRACPELVIVDEAHTSVADPEATGRRHQRHRLLVGLADDPRRHLILVTATPHSGKEEAFRGLLALLDPAFGSLPEDLSGTANEPLRRRLARHMVQRRRGDIRHFLAADTPFPERLEREETYALTGAYRELFNDVLAYARETATRPAGGADASADASDGVDRRRQRVRWWAALSLLRALGSSPVAAATSLRKRASVLDAASAEEADALGRRAILDEDLDEEVEGRDVLPGGDASGLAGDVVSPSEAAGGEAATALEQRRLRALAERAEALAGVASDAKLAATVALVKALHKAGHAPIIFCRFIPTAGYVAAQLSSALGAGVTVDAVTGLLPPEEREARVEALADAERRVLVCTDCLSEGINLQERFDAVIHYDLSWNPTRHEQREGRVDRFGQPRPEVRMVTIYGRNNPIDGIVLEVLLRKQSKIRKALGVSVPVPVNAGQVVEAVIEGLLLRGKPIEEAPARSKQGLLFPDLELSKRDELFAEWDAAADREKRSRTVFAQETMKTDEVRRELEAARDAVGAASDVERFVRDALGAYGGTVEARPDGWVRLGLAETPKGLRDSAGGEASIDVRFAASGVAGAAAGAGDAALPLTRAHPLVEGIAAFVLGDALDGGAAGAARRAGAIRTRAVSTRTTLLVLRLRFHLVVARAEGETTLLAEESALAAFEGAPEAARWLEPAAAEALLAAEPSANIHADQARTFVERVIEGYAHLAPRLDALARERADALLAAHVRVRQQSGAKSGAKGVRSRVEPVLPPDVVGVYVLLPSAQAKQTGSPTICAGGSGPGPATLRASSRR